MGSGYRGLVTSACLADLGDAVFCDIDERRVDRLRDELRSLDWPRIQAGPTAPGLQLRPGRPAPVG